MIDVMPSTPTEPIPVKHHGRMKWTTRWYGDEIPSTGRRPRYTRRFGDCEKVTHDQAVAAWKRWLKGWKGSSRAQNPKLGSVSATVADVCIAYLKYAEAAYQKNGRPTSHVLNIRTGLQHLIDAYGDLVANQLTPPMLARWRDSLATADRHRGTVNKWLGIVKQAWKWAHEQGWIETMSLYGVQAVNRVKYKRTRAKESTEVQPVDWSYVQQTMPHMSEQIRAMVHLLWLTGARPDEICQLRPCDIEAGGDVWLFRPKASKLDHIEDASTRIVCVGPQAQKVLKPLLPKDRGAYVFSPRRTDRSPARSAHRYTSQTLRVAVHRACDRAYPPPGPLALRKGETPQARHKRLTSAQWSELKAWQQAHRWNPNQLRHTRATELNKVGGLEAARVILGHRKPATTTIYAQRDLAKAIKLSKRTG